MVELKLPFLGKSLRNFLKQMFVKGFKNFSSMIKQASKKICEKFYKLLSKQEIRVLQAFKEKQVQKQASKEKF